MLFIYWSCKFALRICATSPERAIFAISFQGYHYHKTEHSSSIFSIAKVNPILLLSTCSHKIILILGGKPYLFDYNTEVRIYNKIGVLDIPNDYLGSFEKYSQWKEYIQKKYSNLKNNQRFLSFLK